MHLHPRKLHVQFSSTHPQQKHQQWTGKQLEGWAVRLNQRHCLPWHKAVNGWQGLSTPALRHHGTGSLPWVWGKSQTREVATYTALNGDEKEAFTGAAKGRWKHSSAVTHLKSPSSFSCCTSLDTIGLINTLLIIVPMTKYPKMLTGPSQPVLQRRKKSQLIIQAKGHPCTIRLKQSEDPAVTSLCFHRSLGANTAHPSIPKAEFSLERPLTHVYKYPSGEL